VYRLEDDRRRKEMEESLRTWSSGGDANGEWGDASGWDVQDGWGNLVTPNVDSGAEEEEGNEE
jgi:hypothetical protein